MSEQLTYSYNAEENFKYSLTEELCIKNAPFGTIEITRNKEFTKNEFDRLAYLYPNLFYQGATRVREELSIIVVNAPDLFKKIASIIRK